MRAHIKQKVSLRMIPSECGCSARGRGGESSAGMAVDAAFPVKSTEDRLSIMTARYDPTRQMGHPLPATTRVGNLLIGSSRQKCFLEGLAQYPRGI